MIDRTHVPWAWATGLLLVASVVLYVIGTEHDFVGPRGGSPAGLTLGIVAVVFLLFAALFGVRKRRPHYRLGRASTWLKGHLWLGAASFPIALLHGGFGFGGVLTQVLMWLFIVVFVTGLYGVALQHLLPRLMTRNVTQETVYEQIAHVRRQLYEEALGVARGTGGAVARGKGKGAVRGRVVKGRGGKEGAGDDPAREPLLAFVQERVRPYFLAVGARRADLAHEHRRRAIFDELRRQLPANLHDATRDLEALCAQREQLALQARLHRWLHGWLLVHVPCAWAVVLLTLIHAVSALYY